MSSRQGGTRFAASLAASLRQGWGNVLETLETIRQAKHVFWRVSVVCGGVDAWAGGGRRWQVQAHDWPQAQVPGSLCAALQGRGCFGHAARCLRAQGVG